MPRKNLAGTFEGSPNYRWTKMVRGKRWRLLCRAQRPGEIKERTVWLGLPESQWTATGSQAAANEWWRKNDSQTLSPELMERVQKVAKLVRAIDRVGLPLNDESIAAINPLLDQIEEPPPTPTHETVKYWAEKYLELKLPKLKDRTPARYDNLKRSIFKMVASVGADKTITAINWQAWDAFEIAVKSSGMGEYGIRDAISDCRGFIRHLMRRKIIPPVENIAESKIKIRPKRIEYFSPEELRRMLSESDGMLRVFLLLFCNCGFRQKDVATLTPEMLNEKSGYITRQRSKVEYTDAPIVSWKLWPETLKAIQQLRNKTGLVLTRANGLPWVVEGLNEKQNRKRDDAFRRELWLDFAERLDLKLSADAIRRSCANLLTTNSTTTNQISIQIKFLGQVPSGVASRHYIDPQQPEMDAAVMGLRDILFPPTKKRSARKSD